MTDERMAHDPVSIGRFYPDVQDPQTPADVAVVMPTILRPRIVTAIRSVFAQTFAGRIQLMIGVDKAADSPEPLERALAERPPHASAVVLHLPYSTSVRHGGVHPATDGGALRAILSFMANTRYVAYLDDDNAWEPEHLAGLMEAVRGKAWAHSLRMLIDETTGQELGVDRWDSVGVNAGRFAARGGLVDVNCLLVDKVAAARAFGRWTEGPGDTSDRNFFAAIKDAPHGRVERPTVRYGIRPTNVLNQFLRDNTQF
jgi:hypothetical protein